MIPNLEIHSSAFCYNKVRGSDLTEGGILFDKSAQYKRIL